MASNKKSKNNTNSSSKNYSNKKNQTGKIEEAKKNTISKNTKKNIAIMKFLTFLGVIVFFAALVYLMNYFFVKKSYLQINMSTDKKLEYMTFNGKEELVPTQKYVSDLNYSMRYDIDNFKVFKYKKQDIFKFLNAEKILVIVEKGTTPKNCSTSDNEVYNSCMVTLDEYTKIYYVKENNNNTYKITVKTPDANSYKEEIKARINYMLNSFTIIN